jgi:hypothetical protein
MIAHDPEVPPTELPTEVNVLLALLPRVVMAAMHTTMMSANMTAYSTAVGPSSFFRNLTRLWEMRDNTAGVLSGPEKKDGYGHERPVL